MSQIIFLNDINGLSGIFRPDKSESSTDERSFKNIESSTDAMPSDDDVLSN